MDGLSMANTGAVKESTSADLTNRTEQLIHADKTNDSKQVQTLSTNRRVREKDEEESSKQQKQENSEEEVFDDDYLPSDNEEVSEDFIFVSCLVEFSLILRDSEYKASASLTSTASIVFAVTSSW